MDIDGFSMYPNPVTSGKVYISTAANAPKEILIYDVFGTLLLKTKILAGRVGGGYPHILVYHILHPILYHWTRYRSITEINIFTNKEMNRRNT